MGVLDRRYTFPFFIMNTFTRTITNELHSLESLMHAITNFLEDQGVEAKAVYQINLALEEMITNIIKFGYADYDSHEIHVSMEVGEEEVVARIEDDGREFNPLEEKPVAHGTPLEEKKVGGLGIHLIKKLLHSMEYRREGHRNILEIKALKKQPEA